MNLKHIIYDTKGWLTVMSALLLLVGCAKKPQEQDVSVGVLLRAGDKVLTLDDVVRRIPVGIESSDSAAMFRRIVDNWVKTQVLSNLAERKLPDIADIENRVEEYRNRLIVSEYLNEMRKGKAFNISADSIRDFYNRYKGEMLLESPLVKGIYMKVASERANLDEIRELVFCGSDDCIDKLEKSWASHAIQYEYFIGDWVDWQTIADRVPYRFYDPNAFLKSTKNFETEYNGCVYFLHISEYLPTGSEPPYEFAAIRIAELMERADMNKFEETLVRSLVAKAISDGDLVASGYDPIKGSLTLGAESPQETSPGIGDRNTD